MAARTNMYREMLGRHQEETNSFPMFFAFSNEQFDDGMRRFGLNPEDTVKVYSIGGGGYIRREDVGKLGEMFGRHHRERQKAINADKKGTGFIYDMFRYELANHEYGYTQDLDDTLDSLKITMEEIEQSPALTRGLKKAMAVCTKKTVMPY